MTLYTQVASNRRKTSLYLLVYVVLIIALGGVISWYYGSPDILLIAAVISIVLGWVSYYHSDSIALMVSRAEPLEQTANPELYKTVENLTITAGLPMPQIYFINDTAINTFATGRDPQHAAIAVTTGALDRLNQNELAGVLAHELSHIGNEDIRLSSMVAVMAGLIALISDLFLRNMFWGRSRDSDNNSQAALIGMVIALVLAVLAPIAATLIQLAISRKREFMADASGVLLTRYPEGLISALRKIEADTEPLEAANRGTAHMYFSNPLKGKNFASLFDTHPPVEERIAALEQGGGARS